LRIGFVLKHILKHFFRGVQKPPGDPVVLRFLIRDGAQAFLRQVQHLPAGVGHKHRRVGGNDELGVPVFQVANAAQQLQLPGGGEGGFAVDTAAPILSEGDVLGCVLFLASAGQQPSGEVEYKLAQSIAAFLGKHMEF